MKPTETQVGGDHYKDMPIQPATFILKNGIPFHEGSAIKYLCRWRRKGGVEDLKKARHFIDMLIEGSEEEPTTPPPPEGAIPGIRSGETYLDWAKRIYNDWASFRNNGLLRDLIFIPLINRIEALESAKSSPAPPKKKAIWHNPDNLESAGEGYRFLIAGVETTDSTHFWAKVSERWKETYRFTYRTNKPLPDGWEA